MKNAAYEVSLLALCCWREAAIDGDPGMRAVAHVVRNRVNHKDFPNSFAEVICQKNQFSSMTLKGDAMTVRWPSVNDNAFAWALAIAEQVYYDPSAVDPTHGAIFYRNPQTATSEWYEENIIQSGHYQQTAQIGHHVFHKPIQVADYDTSTWGDAA